MNKIDYNLMKGYSTTVISVYVPRDTNLDSILKHIEDEFVYAIDIKSGASRKETIRGLQNIKTILNVIKWVGYKEGFVIFAHDDDIDIKHYSGSIFRYHQASDPLNWPLEEEDEKK